MYPCVCVRERVCVCIQRERLDEWVANGQVHVCVCVYVLCMNVADT